MKVIVCGTRGCVSNDVRWNLGNELFQMTPSLVIHGACPNSADELAEEWADEHGVETYPCPATWEDGPWSASGTNLAGFKRNSEMANLEADFLIAVWDGKSNGTRDMIEKAVKKGIFATIIPAKI